MSELLAVPYLVQAGTVESAPGIWVRQASYPELPGCTAEAATIEDALRLLERRRVEIIVDTVRAGGQPPVPRPPLAGCDPHALVAALGLTHLLSTGETRE